MYSVASHINFDIKTWQKLREGEHAQIKSLLKRPYCLLIIAYMKSRPIHIS